MKIKEQTSGTHTPELKGIPREILMEQIDPNDGAVNEICELTEDEKDYLLIKYYQDVKYLKAAIVYLKERLTK
jgi:hypothetical protein